MIRFACPECRWTLEVPEDQGGGTVRCPCCGRSLGVPTLVPVAGVARPPAGASVSASAIGAPRTPWGLARALPLTRFGSPASLFLALLLFPLPWIEVRCNGPVGGSEARTLAKQSGLQAAYGGYSEAPLSPAARSERDRIEARVHASQVEPTVSWSPLMAVYPFALLGGCWLGLRARRDWVRSAAVVGCSLAAALLFLLQASKGFPLEQAVRTVDTQGRVAGTDFRIALNTSGLVEVGYTPWFWLSAVALTGALAAPVADWCLTRGAVRRRNFLRSG